MLKRNVDSIILDVGGTLSEEISWLKITESLGASPNEHALIFEQLKKGLLSYPQAKNKLLSLWQLTGNANRNFMERTFRSWDLRSSAREVVDYLKQSYRVCLISGSIDLYVQAVAEKLDVSDWYANTELIWDASGNLVDFDYYQNQAQKKLDQFLRYIKQNGFKAERCAVVGDGDNDVALFKAVKFPIEINKVPRPELKGLAFKSIRNLQDLKKIF